MFSLATNKNRVHLILLFLLIVSSVLILLNEEQNRNYYDRPFQDGSVMLSGGEIRMSYSAYHHWETDEIELRVQLDNDQEFEIALVHYGYWSSDSHTVLNLPILNDTLTSFYFPEGADIQFHNINYTTILNGGSEHIENYLLGEPVLSIQLMRNEVYHHYQPILLVYFAFIFSLLFSIFFGLQRLRSSNTEEIDELDMSNEKTPESKVRIYVIFVVLSFIYFRLVDIPLIFFIFSFPFRFLLALLPLILSVSVYFLSFREDRLKPFRDDIIAIIVAISTVLFFNILSFFTIILIPFVLYFLGIRKMTKSIKETHRFVVLLHTYVAQFIFFYFILYYPIVHFSLSYRLLLGFISMIYTIISLHILYQNVYNPVERKSLISYSIIMSLVNFLIYLILSFILRITIFPTLIG